MPDPLRIFCKNVTKNPDAVKVLDNLMRTHPFDKWSHASYFQDYNNFYILEKFDRYGNYIGFTPEGQIGTFQKTRLVSYEELLIILNGIDPKELKRPKTIYHTIDLEFVDYPRN